MEVKIRKEWNDMEREFFWINQTCRRISSGTGRNVSESLRCTGYAFGGEKLCIVSSLDDES